MTIKEVLVDFLRSRVDEGNPIVANHDFTETLPKYGRQWHDTYHSGGSYERIWRQLRNELPDYGLKAIELKTEGAYLQWKIEKTFTAKLPLGM